ncbi:helix-turn-helix domain-containing protein [Gilliamella sp. B2824]|uniref:helix-turn-helix domain-containing protein n=1 Tax=Gilliamella sp. B2824 TaxID=2818019 RepID=UPI002B488995|nr:helix-turn-helix domain-containing protein [Gilliamella sp. B2824]
MNSKKDWHSADIIAALKKKGTTLSNALVRPWTKGELIIANALGIEAKRIWPSRYRKKIRVLRIKKCEYNHLISITDNTKKSGSIKCMT